MKNELALSERITRWRESRDLTKADLARLLNVSTAAVSLWEQGASSLTLDRVTALADALGITLSEFFGPLPKAKTAKAG